VNPLQEIPMKLFSAHLHDLRELYVNNLQKAVDMEIAIIRMWVSMCG